MLILRFQRVGKKHDTTFRVVAVDSRFSSKSGKVKEILGWWDPRKDNSELKTERINYWLKNGAQTSDSCYNLLVKAKIIEGKKRPIVIHKKKTKEGEIEAKPQEVKSDNLQEEKELTSNRDSVKEVNQEDTPEEESKDPKEEIMQKEPESSELKDDTST
jgi:small subunit ribosomal protein S16